MQFLQKRLHDLYDHHPELQTKLEELLKTYYDKSKRAEPRKFASRTALPQLHTQGFDHTQIWAQLKLGYDHLLMINDKKGIDWIADSLDTLETVPTMDAAIEVKNTIAKSAKSKSKEPSIPTDKPTSKPTQVTSGVSSGRSSKSERTPSSQQSTQQATTKQKGKKAAKKDDNADFFSIDDMMRFADDVDAGNVEDIDLFTDLPQDDADAVLAIKYEDFFGSPDQNGEDHDEDDYDEDDEMDDYDEDDQMDDVYDEDDEMNDVDALDFDEDDLDEDDMESLLAYGEGEDFNYDDLGYGEGEGFEVGFDDDEDNEFYDDLDEDEEEQDKKRFRQMFLDDDDDDTTASSLKKQMNSKKSRQENKSTPSFMNIDDTEHVVDHLLTPYEEKQKTVRNQIDAIEQELMGPKQWAMAGEVTSHQREQDSLVHHDLDFDLGIKLTAPITNEVALEFEEIIRSRIRDHVFDDVIPRVQLEAKPFKEREEVSSEKPRYGLAELYEKEYMTMATGISDNEVRLQEKHRDITALFSKINHELDALSNYYHTAKDRTKELTITSTVSIAGAKEDILPVMANDTNTTAAPQEVYQPEVHALATSKTELSKQEKDAAQRRRKEQKKKHFKADDEKTRLAAIGGDEKSQKKIENKQLEKDYKKAAKSSRVTVQKTNRNVGDNTKYTSFTQFAHKMQDNTVNTNQKKRK